MNAERKLRVLALLPDVPAAASTGGAVRAFHFLRALLHHTDVQVYVLGRADAKSVDTILQESGRIHWCGLPVGERSRKKASAVQRVLQTVLMPWAKHGRGLMLAGENLCVQRSRVAGFWMGHRCYALLLLALFAVSRRLFRLDTGDVHVRGSALEVAFQKIRSQPGECQPDVIWLEHSYLYSVGERIQALFPRAQIVVNAHNVEQQLKTMIGQSQKTLLGRLWGHQEASLMGDIERRMVHNAALVYCCSEADRLRFLNQQRTSGCQLSVVPNGVDTRYFQLGQGEKQAETLIFTGTAGYKPNDDAVQWLVEKILPAIRRIRPGVRLILAGMNAGLRWGQYQRLNMNIEVHSSVPDMRPLLGRAMVSVVPLLSGSGTRLKILEALSSGCAVVSTSIGAEGLDVIPGRDLLIADTEEEFVSTICRLLQDDVLRRRLCEQGRQLVEQEYDWRALEQRAGSILTTVQG